MRTDSFIAEGKKHCHISRMITLQESMQLIEKHQNGKDLLSLVTDVFFFGVAAGYRQCKAALEKNREENK